LTENRFNQLINLGKHFIVSGVNNISVSMVWFDIWEANSLN